MLHSLRSFMTSKVGVFVTLAVLAVIAFAFAVGDVANTGTFGGVAGGDRVAIVGDKKVSTSDLSSVVASDFERFRRDNPTATMEAYIAGGGMERSLNQMLDRVALAEFAREHGFRAGDRLVDSELIQFAAFQGADGRFDEDIYRSVISQQGLSDQLMRDDLAQGLLARQVLLPATLEGSLPRPLVKRYAALLRERREGEIGLLLSTAYAPEEDPTDEQLQAFYSENRTDYLQPERRVIRYVTFDETSLSGLREPTDAEIDARFRRDSTQYAASETRQLTQLVLPTRDAADAVVAEVAGGKSLSQAARDQGLAVAQIGPVSESDLAEQTSAAVAEAAFSADQGAIATPARGNLGFYVMRIDSIDRKAAQTLDMVRSQISEELANEQRTAALADLSSEIDDEISRGSSLTEVAQKLDAEIETVSEATADGRIFGTQGETVPEAIQPVVSTAFDMREGEPQLTEVVPGESFLIFDVSEITPSTAPPLAEIKDGLVGVWKRSEGSKAAKEAANRVMERIADGDTVTEAMAKEDVQLPPVDTIDMNRQQLTQQGRRVPPVLALMFSMAQGTTKRLEAPNDNGWFVVKLDEIETSDLADDDPLIERASGQLSQVAQNELAEQMVVAIKNEIGIERNQAAIDAVEAQLTGRAN